jgi:uncharacterized protein YodC (DUF2158 family)
MTEHVVFKNGDKVRLRSGLGRQMTVRHVAEDGSVHTRWETRIRKNDPTEFIPDELELIPG